MNLGALIAQFRSRARDTVEPYLAPDTEVKTWLNEAQREAAIRARLLRDDYTPEVCKIALTPGTQVYPLHPKLYEIAGLRIKPLVGSPRAICLKSPEWLDKYLPEWRDLTYPSEYAIQYETRIRIVGKIVAGDELEIDCYRLPLDDMHGNGDEPEIHEASHLHLVDWALYRFYGLPDAEVLDKDKERKALDDFEQVFGLRPDSDMRRITREDFPHQNALVLP